MLTCHSTGHSEMWMPCHNPTKHAIPSLPPRPPNIKPQPKPDYSSAAILWLLGCTWATGFREKWSFCRVNGLAPAELIQLHGESRPIDNIVFKIQQWCDWGPRKACWRISWHNQHWWGRGPELAWPSSSSLYRWDDWITGGAEVTHNPIYFHLSSQTCAFQFSPFHLSSPAL